MICASASDFRVMRERVSDTSDILVIFVITLNWVNDQNSRASRSNTTKIDRDRGIGPHEVQRQYFSSIALVMSLHWNVYEFIATLRPSRFCLSTIQLFQNTSMKHICRVGTVFNGTGSAPRRTITLRTSLKSHPNIVRDQHFS